MREASRNFQDTASDDGSAEAAPLLPDPATEGASQDGGANSTSGPYDPDPADPGASGVGQPSGNGKSTDNNGNRPCAGCVGKADYKNPPGQLPDGSDHNKGYECDENEGIGQMNPAHSGCAPGPPPLSNPPAPTVTPPTLAVTPPAGAPPESPPPEVVTEEVSDVLGENQGPELPEAPAAPPAAAVIPATQVVTPAAETLEKLPLTGGQPLFLGLLGLLMLVSGLGMARLLRTRSHA